MIFEGRVWRHVPAGAHPLNFEYLITASGRWNRRGQYGCLYTALTPETTIAEYTRAVKRRGIRPRRDLVAFEVRIDSIFDLSSALESSDTRLTARGGELELLILRNDSRVTGDSEDDLEFCRAIADAVRLRQECRLVPVIQRRRQRRAQPYPEPEN